MASMTSMARARAINKKSKILTSVKHPFAEVTNKLYKKIAKWSKSKEKVTSKATREAIINDAEGVDDADDAGAIEGVDDVDDADDAGAIEGVDDVDDAEGAGAIEGVDDADDVDDAEGVDEARRGRRAAR